MAGIALTTPLWTALVTPFTENNQIDYPVLAKLLKAQEAAGNGVLMLGSTGESLAFSHEEKQKILQFVIDQKLSVPLMVGVGGINIESTKEWVSYLETLSSINAYLLVTPLYAKPGAKGQEEWFRQLLDLSTRPCMLYNVPSRTGGVLHLKAVKNLNTHPNFWAIKEASGSFDRFLEYVQAAGKVRVYSGDDALLPQYALIGAKGLVSVASNVWPAQCRLVVEKCLKHQFQQDLASLWNGASSSLFLASNPVPVKVLMAKLGMLTTPKVRAPLDHRDMPEDAVAVVMDWHQKIENWYKENK